MHGTYLLGSFTSTNLATYSSAGSSPRLASACSFTSSTAHCKHAHEGGGGGWGHGNERAQTEAASRQDSGEKLGRCPKGMRHVADAEHTGHGSSSRSSKRVSG